MPQTNQNRFAVCLSLGLVVAGGVTLVAGCGGGGGTNPVSTPTPLVLATPTPTPTPSTTPTPGATPTPTPSAVPAVPLRAVINWPARSRDLNAPSSALSCVISTTTGDAFTGGPIRFAPIARTGGAAAYTQTLSVPGTIRVGATTFNIRFYANADGTGAVVGETTVNATVAADGTGLPTIAASTKIATVNVTPNLTVSYGTTAQIGFTAFDASGTALAITPGSAFFAPATGTSTALTISGDGVASSVPIGNALTVVPPSGPLDNVNVTATVDGVASSPQAVKVVVGAGALTTTASGLKYRDVVVGAGNPAASGQTATINYYGYLDTKDIGGGLSDSGSYSLFDSSFLAGRSPLQFRLGTGAVVAGFDEGTTGMRPGGIRIIVIPPGLAYGANPPQGSSIPANSALIFIIQLNSAQ